MRVYVCKIGTKSACGVDVKMSEVTFFGKQLKLDKEEDGMVSCLRTDLYLNAFSTAVDVVKAIEGAEDLETLILSGNTCGVEACKAIGTALGTKPTFKVYQAAQITSMYDIIP